MQNVACHLRVLLLSACLLRRFLAKQALPHGLHIPGQGHHMPVQHGLEPYIPLMPSLSLDSFFASCDEREAAAHRAQQPPAMMENVLPAWGEDLINGPGGSLQAGADWQACAVSSPI